MLNSSDLVTAEYMRFIDETAAGKTYEKLIERLPHSQESALHYRELCQTLNINGRNLRYLIRDARLDGIPVCAGDAGVWIADTKEHWNRYMKREHHKLNEQKRLYTALCGINQRISHKKGGD